MGGKKSVTIGYRYYMGIHQAICHGPVESVGPVYAGEREIAGISASYSNGNVQQVFANSPDLFGGEKKEGGIQGAIDIMFGDSTQGQNGYLLSRVGASSSLVPAFRGIVSAVCKKIYIAAMSPYPKPWWWTVTDIPQKSWYPETATIQRAGQRFKGANPAHIIRDILLNPDYGLGLHFTRLDDTSFRAVALALYNEVFSMSLIHSAPEKAREFIQIILRHINGILYQDRTSGLIKIRLLRDDFVKANLPLFDTSNIITLGEFQRPSYAEMVNEIVLVYRRRGEFKDTVAVFHDLASIQAQGGIISQQVQFPGIDDDIIAGIIGNRELRQQSTPLAQVKLTVNRTGSSIVPGDPIRFTWPALGITEMVLRVIKTDQGDPRNNRVILECVEDIFALGTTKYLSPVDPIWQDPVVAPQPVLDSRVDELSYYDIATRFEGIPGFFTELMNTDAYIQGQAVASSPSPEYEIWDKLQASSLYTSKGSGVYTPSARLMENIDEKRLTVMIDHADEFELSEIEVGSYGYIGNEIVRIDQINFGTKVVTVGRGCLDSVPEPHLIGDRLWFTEGFTAFDDTKWQMNNTLDCRLLPRTGQGLFSVNDPLVTTLSKTLKARHYLPFPPGNVVFTNGGSYPTVLYDSGAVPATRMTWVNRNRLLQTVPGSLNDFFDGNITPEANITYEVGYFKETNLHGTVPNRIYTVPSATNQAEWTDEIADSAIPSFVMPPNNPDLEMAFYDNVIGGSLSPSTTAQNVVNTSFYQGNAQVTFGGGFDLGIFSLSGTGWAMSFDFIPDDLSTDRYQTLIAKQVGSGGFQIGVFYDRVQQRLATAFNSAMAPTTSANAVVFKKSKNQVLVIYTASSIAVYLNGVLANSLSFGLSYIGNPWILGQAFTTFGGPKQYFFSGKIGNLRIYNNQGLLASSFVGPNRPNKVFKVTITTIRTEGASTYKSYVPWSGIFSRTGWGNTWNQNFSGRI